MDGIAGSHCVSIARLEVLLDEFARGVGIPPRELEGLQAHFLTCWYCGSLMTVAENLRVQRVATLSRAAAA
jgi:hypothetical protein